jgi:hypothetical protein
MLCNYSCRRAWMSRARATQVYQTLRAQARNAYPAPDPGSSRLARASLAGGCALVWKTTLAPFLTAARTLGAGGRRTSGKVRMARP